MDILARHNFTFARAWTKVKTHLAEKPVPAPQSRCPETSAPACVELSLAALDGLRRLFYPNKEVCLLDIPENREY